MKRLFPGKALFMAIMFAIITFSVTAADYYVVIGSFKNEANALRFTQSVRNVFQDASYSFNQDRKLYFVHVMKTHVKEEARNWSLYLKNEKGFKDAWVFAGEATDVKPFVPEADVAAHREARFSASVPQPNHINKWALASAGAEENMARYSADALAAAWTHKDGFSFLRNAENYRGLVESSDADMGRQFKFIVEDPSGAPIDGEVCLVNFEKSKVLASFQSGERVLIKGTRRGQMVTFVCEVLGYGMETRMFNMDHLSRGRDIVRNEDGVWEVHIRLQEMKVFDQAILYNTIFHRDATALEPSSKEELDELVKMMQLHPEYKIVVHSHCNAGPRRDIALTSDDFFGEHISSVRRGTDKFLTRKRALVVRDYLISHGIDKRRIGTVGWGSMEMIVKPTAEDVRLNERIEVELVSDEG